MSSIFDILAEQRIADALKRGEFDYLPGAGRPLVFEDEPFQSPEQRMANRILKNAGFVPQEVLLRREIASLRKALASDDGADEAEKAHLRRRLGMLVVTLGSLLRR
ncbi:DUF1992 domain-containing protein [Aromatoleum petrolei]|uniref:DUF1992 domain-containing protein n=1 Tax=Aromatoleum petrolei TaxID=76116 RepID=A0ABX1MQU4_9RHOO|nr:DUF1992 domain-containing protein [Aromatoleum petrolei]NMF90319.1 DUF1992 domain-containing protein [Aromatoleum petrolei]QTQ37079.1 putative protein DUF1992 [Aromatoleum petrolei]